MTDWRDDPGWTTCRNSRDTGEDFAAPRARDNCGEVDWGLPAAHPGWPRGSSSRWGLAASRPPFVRDPGEAAVYRAGNGGYGIDAPEHFSCTPDNCRNRCGAEVFGLVPGPDTPVRRRRTGPVPESGPPSGLLSSPPPRIPWRRCFAYYLLSIERRPFSARHAGCLAGLPKLDAAVNCKRSWWRRPWPRPLRLLMMSRT